MPSRSMFLRTLVQVVLGSLGVVIPLLGILILMVAAALAVYATSDGRRWDRFLPGATLAAIVAAAYLAPVKMIDEVLARRMTVPKVVMTVAELRDPDEHGLGRPSTSYLLGGGGDDATAQIEGLSVRFPSTELSLREFIRAIEEQTPFRHEYLGGCGNCSSILYGSSATYLGFRLPRP